MPEDVGADKRKKNDNDNLTRGVAFSVDFGIERDIIKKINELKERDEKAKSALKSRLVEYVSCHLNIASLRGSTFVLKTHANANHYHA